MPGVFMDRFLRHSQLENARWGVFYSNEVIAQLELIKAIVARGHIDRALLAIEASKGLWQARQADFSEQIEQRFNQERKAV